MSVQTQWDVIRSARKSAINFHSFGAPFFELLVHTCKRQFGQNLDNIWQHTFSIVQSYATFAPTCRNHAPLPRHLPRHQPSHQRRSTTVPLQCGYCGYLHTRLFDLATGHSWWTSRNAFTGLYKTCHEMNMRDSTRVSPMCQHVSGQRLPTKPSANHEFKRLEFDITWLHSKDNVFDAFSVIEEWNIHRFGGHFSTVPSVETMAFFMSDWAAEKQLSWGALWHAGYYIQSKHLHCMTLHDAEWYIRAIKNL